jgi:hypothetical protein
VKQIVASTVAVVIDVHATRLGRKRPSFPDRQLLSIHMPSSPAQNHQLPSKARYPIHNSIGHGYRYHSGIMDPSCRKGADAVFSPDVTCSTTQNTISPNKKKQKGAGARMYLAAHNKTANCISSKIYELIPDSSDTDHSASLHLSTSTRRRKHKSAFKPKECPNQHNTSALPTNSPPRFSKSKLEPEGIKDLELWREQLEQQLRDWDTPGEIARREGMIRDYVQCVTDCSRF